MILYRCICGKEFVVPDNSEDSRARKRAWKKAHDKKQAGHNWSRIVMKGKSQ